MSAGVGQSRRASLVEALANVGIGYAAAIVLQIVLFPMFGFQPGLAQHAGIAASFTVASLARSFLLRRLFQHIEARRAAERDRRAKSLQRRLDTGRL